MKKFLGICAISLIAFGTANASADQCITKIYRGGPNNDSEIKSNLLVVSENGNGFMFLNEYLTGSDASMRSVVWNGIELPGRYVDIKPRPKISDNGKNIAYVAKTASDSEYVLYKNGKPLGSGMGTEVIRFSKDGRSLYSVSQLSSEQYIYAMDPNMPRMVPLDGKDVPFAPSLFKDGKKVDAPDLASDRKSEWFNYYFCMKLWSEGYVVKSYNEWGCTVSDKNGKVSTYVAGKKAGWSNVPKPTSYGTLKFESGESLRYYVSVECGKKKCVIDENGKTVGNKSGYDELDLIAYGNFIGRSYIKTAVTEEFVSDGKYFGKVTGLSEVSDPKRSKFAFIANLKGSKKPSVIMDWAVVPPESSDSVLDSIRTDYAGPLRLIPLGASENVLQSYGTNDGKHSVKVVLDPKTSKRGFWFDGKQVGSQYDEISSPVISPNGRRIAFVGKKVTLVEKIPRSTYSVVAGGKTITLVAKEPKYEYAVVVDGKEIRSYDYLDTYSSTNWAFKFAFSPDSKTYAFGNDSMWGFSDGSDVPFAGKNGDDSGMLRLEFLRSKYSMLVGLFSDSPDRKTGLSTTTLYLKICKP